MRIRLDTHAFIWLASRGPVTVDHVVRLEQLPRHHKDPFDRMIAAQALEEDLPVIGRDRMLDEYGVDRRW